MEKLKKVKDQNNFYITFMLIAWSISIIHHTNKKALSDL